MLIGTYGYYGVHNGRSFDLCVLVIGAFVTILYAGWLLLKDHRRPTDSFPFEVDGDFDTVGNFYKRNSFVHPVVFTVEGHCPLTVPVPVPLPLIANVSFSCLVTPRIVKSPSNTTVSGPICSTFVE